MSERPLSLSTLPATTSSRRAALAVVLASTLIFVTVAPFARAQLPRIDAFIPIYESVLVINDVITAVLLFGQFKFHGSRALLILASAYVFTAFITVAHALTFPGLFAPSGLLGANMQSTAWLYMFWHAVFPVMVIAYALLEGKERSEIEQKDRTRAALLAVVIALTAIWLLTFLATRGADVLPAIMQGNRYTPAQVAVITIVWILSLIALAVLWRRQKHSLLGLWLMVVMCAWLFDMALAAVLNAARFDLGFYAGRIYGLLASSFVLIVLLFEGNALYGRLIATQEGERREHAMVLEKTRELVTLNKELDAFSYSVSHDLRAPLRAIDGYTRMLEEDYASRLDAEGNRLLGVVRASSARMGRLIDDLLAFSRTSREPLRTRPVELDDLVRRVIEELRGERDGRAIDFAIGKLGVAEADPALLGQALANLMSNAIKFTRDCTPAVIEIGCRRAGTADNAAIYFVKDNGAGFDMKYSDKLFGVFQRLHSAKEFPGTGVGLAMVNRIIARHGGKIWAESRKGEGATFYFTLSGDRAGEVQPT